MGGQIALCEIFLQIQFSASALLLSCQTENGSFTFVNSGGTISIELQSLANRVQSEPQHINNIAMRRQQC